MLPAVVADHGPRRIERAGEMSERPHVLALGRIAFEVEHAPALVDRHPGHDAGMADVAADHVQPLAGEPLDAAVEKS